jgi:fluoride exporter
MERDTLFCIMAGGAAGAAARFLLNGWFQRKYGTAFPWGILVINVTGCLLLGLLVGLRANPARTVPEFLSPAFGVGFLGAYTTFSTFAVDTLLLAEGKQILAAALNVLISVALGLAAGGIGLMLGRRL